MATRAADKTTRRYDPAETRQRVLDAAVQLFSTKGYVNTVTADIARAADVSEGSIFYHFGSKKALLAELGRRHGEAMIAAMQGSDRLEDLDPGTTVARCFVFCRETTLWDRVSKLTGDCPHSKDGLNPEAAPFFQAARTVIVEWVTRQLGAAFEKHGITGINPGVAAALTYAAVGDGLDQAMAADIGEAEAAAIEAETVRYVRAACGFGHLNG